MVDTTLSADKDAMGHFVRRSNFMSGKVFLNIPGSDDLSGMFRAIKYNYQLFQTLVDSGFESWMTSDSYEVGDWVRLFTPIEQAAWHDIRELGLPFWPQLPVGRFFVDFGNPVAKIALECDGRQWHDPIKDAARDKELRALGWLVFRADGQRCMRVIDRPENYDDLSDAEREDISTQRHQETMTGVIADISSAFKCRAAQQYIGDNRCQPLNVMESSHG